MENFYEKIDKIYQAIRKTYGYAEDADELIDLVGEMTDVLEDKLKQE